jgi:hypothetical protein
MFKIIVPDYSDYVLLYRFSAQWDFIRKLLADPDEIKNTNNQLQEKESCYRFDCFINKEKTIYSLNSSEFDVVYT